MYVCIYIVCIYISINVRARIRGVRLSSFIVLQVKQQAYNI